MGCCTFVFAATARTLGSRRSRPLVESSRHRRERKKRTQARTILRTATSGLVDPFSWQVEEAAVLLRQHHSASQLPLQLDRIRAMTWQCSQCKQWAKATANYCPNCGSGASTYSAASSHQAPWHGPRRDVETWGSQAWHADGSDWKRHPSPRRRQPSPRRKGKENKGKQKLGKGPHDRTGKGLPKEGEQMPMVPSTAQLPAAPNLVASVPPKAAVTMVQPPTMEKQQLEVLMQSLQAHRGQIPPETLQVLDKLQADSTQSSARNMHRAVAARTNAKKELDRIRSNRILYLDQWHTYVDGVVAMLTKQMSEQATALAQLAEREAEWAEAFQRAQADLKRLAVVDAEEAAAEEDEDAMDSGEAMVDAALRDAAEIREEQARQEQHRQAVLQQLQVISEQAKEQAESSRREGSRTPRRSKADTNEGPKTQPEVEKAKDKGKDGLPLPPGGARG